MAAIAGKVAITPKGEWDVATQYEKLDFILHGDDSYVARKASLGVEPGTDDETWQLSLRGASSQQINDILNGTTPVGDSNSLGGETAEQWQGKIDEKLDKSGGKVTDSITIETNSFNGFKVQRTWDDGFGTYKAVNAVGRVNNAYPSAVLMLDVENETDLKARLDVAENGLFYTVDDGTQHEVFHTGNRPTGTYTGNGNATAREIATGGSGVMLVIRTGYWTSFVFSGGTFSFNGLTKASEVTVNTQLQYQPSTGKLTLWTTDEKFNASGAAYGYTVV